MMPKITYPIDEKIFIEFQQSGVKRELDETDIELVKLVANAANQSYDAGKNGHKNPWPDTYQDIVQFFTERGKAENLQNPEFSHYFKCLIYWTSEAYQEGRRAAKKEAIT